MTKSGGVAHLPVTPMYWPPLPPQTERKTEANNSILTESDEMLDLSWQKQRSKPISDEIMFSL